MSSVNRLSRNDQILASMIIADLNSSDCDELHMTFNQHSIIEKPADFILYLSFYGIAIRHERRVAIIDGVELVSGVSIFEKI